MPEDGVVARDDLPDDDVVAPDARAVVGLESHAAPPPDDKVQGDSSDLSEPAPPRPGASVPAFLRRRPVADYLPIVIVLVFVAYFCKAFYQPGHDWGDDFALYIHQAKALVNGNVGEVIANNRYAIDNSGWSSFSPIAYPWGFPILIAPVIAIWGVNYAKLKLVVILTFLGYLFCLYRLLLHRAGRVPAALIVALIGCSVIFVGWTSSVISDYPYLLFASITLLWIDRCRLRGLFEADGWRDLVILGVLMAFAFSIRREGLALVAAVFAVHVVTVGPRFLRPPAEGSDPDRVSVRWSRIVIPYIAFGATVIGLQLALPSELIPHFPGTGTQQIKPNIIWFRDILVEQIGMKDIGVSRIALFGSWRLAAIVLAVFLSLAVVGIVVRLLTATAEDAVLVVYLLGVSYIVLTAPFHEGRYLLGITPLLAYFAYQALPSLAKWAGVLVRPAVIVSAVALGGLVLANATDMKPAVKYHLQYNGVIHGPTSPEAIEMEQMVVQCTRGDDVVAFFRARAMSMLTDRRSIQTGDINQIMQRSDWYVMEKNSTYSQPLVDDATARSLHLRKIWENSDWVLWLIPGGAADQRRLPCGTT